MIELEEEVAESPVAVKPAMSRDEYITAACEYVGALVKGAVAEGVPFVDAEVLADKVFGWTMDDYERDGDRGAPYSRMGRYMRRELRRYRRVRKGVVVPVGGSPEVEEEQKGAIRERSGRKGPLPRLGQLEGDTG